MDVVKCKYGEKKKILASPGGFRYPVATIQEERISDILYHRIEYRSTEKSFNILFMYRAALRCRATGGHSAKFASINETYGKIL